MKEERLQRLGHFVGDVGDQVDRLREEIEDLEKSLGEIEKILEAERAHSEVVENRDARDQLATGETHELVIEDPPGEEGPDAVSRIDGIVTFVSPQKLDLQAGDTVRVKLTNVGENHANAVATEIVG